MVYMYIFILIAILNLISFSLFALDKFFAIKGMWRISEKTLLLSAVFMGAFGAILAMLLVRHKTKKTLFVVMLPFVMISQILLLSFLMMYIKS